MTDPFELEMQAAVDLVTQQHDQAGQVRMHQRQRRIETRRARAETHLREIWPARLEPGTSYHFLSSGDVDALSYVAMLLQTHRLEYLLFSTWCMAMPNVLQFGDWLDSGAIGRLDAYCGEIFPNQYTDEHETLAAIVRPRGGRCAIFRNHAKIVAGFGPDIAFAIESSANINTNPRTEQSALHVDRELARFYKDYYDGVRSFNRNFDAWQAYPDTTLRGAA